MKKCSYLSISLLLMFVGVFAFTNCGSDEHVAEFDNEAQGSPENVALLRQVMSGGIENNDSTGDDSFVYHGIGVDEDGNVLWKDFTDRTDQLAPLNGEIKTGTLKALARIKSNIKDFDGRRCFYIVRYESDYKYFHEDADYKDAIDGEADWYFGVMPANNSVKVGEQIQFKIKRAVDITWLYTMPNRYFVEIELVK